MKINAQRADFFVLFISCFIFFFIDSVSITRDYYLTCPKIGGATVWPGIGQRRRLESSAREM